MSMSNESMDREEYLKWMETLGNSIPDAQIPRIRREYRRWQDMLKKEEHDKNEAKYIHVLLMMGKAEAEKVWAGAVPHTKDLQKLDTMRKELRSDRLLQVREKYDKYRDVQDKNPAQRKALNWLFRLLFLNGTSVEELLEKREQRSKHGDPTGLPVASPLPEKSTVPQQSKARLPTTGKKDQEKLVNVAQAKHLKDHAVATPLLTNPVQSPHSATKPPDVLVATSATLGASSQVSRTPTKGPVLATEKEGNKTWKKRRTSKKTSGVNDAQKQPMKNKKRKREYAPYVGDWKCKMCGYWNSRFFVECRGNNPAYPGEEFSCKGKRRDSNIECTQPDDGVSRHRQGGFHVGSWLCWFCCSWAAAHAKFCSWCGSEKKAEHTMGEEKGLPPAPGFFRTQAEERDRYYKQYGRYITPPKKKKW